MEKVDDWRQELFRADKEGGTEYRWWPSPGNTSLVDEGIIKFFEDMNVFTGLERFETGMKYKIHCVMRCGQV